MAKDFSKKFYHSGAWAQVRKAYFSKAGGLCEICLAQGKITQGEIVHHKKELTPNNISDPRVSLSFDNLQLVCRDCHMKLHENRRRYIIGADGSVTAKI